MKEPTKAEGQKTYAKPELRQVSLRPEEAVLGACKTAGQTGSSQPTCASPFHCNAIRS